MSDWAGKLSPDQKPHSIRCIAYKGSDAPMSDTECDCGSLAGWAKSLTAELAAARARIEELEAALGVYATPNNWCEGTLVDDDGVKWRVQFAEGSPNGYEIAREALGRE